MGKGRVIYMEQKIRAAEQWYDKNKALYERFSKEVEEIIIKLLKAENIPYQSVSRRVKDKESYLGKCGKEKYTNPTEQIMDVSGIRIIAYTNKDVEKICGVLRDEFWIDEKNSGNKADVLETNKVGYLSVHYILQLSERRLGLAECKKYRDLRCEVQVRTLLQHAWAEIEHDRNYKFSGVLPHEIRRRFYLVAGVLEMMDREFDRLSGDIDEYVKRMENEVSAGNYNLSIDSKSVEQYMLKRFGEPIRIGTGQGGTVAMEDLVEELLRFGYETIQDIEDDLGNYEDILKSKRTYIGVLRDLMIMKDCVKYFREVYSGNWQTVDEDSVRLWLEHGADDVERYLDDYEIYICGK